MFESAYRYDTIDINYIPRNQEIIYTEELGEIPSKPFYSLIKRLFDFVVSFIAIIILFVPMLIIGLIVVIDSRGGPLYTQKRLGKDEKPFRIIKFRTMHLDAEKDGAMWANRDDARSTRFGKFLRHSRLDELPQLFNILAGKMSFVGPRPERPEFYDVFDRYIVGFRQRTKVIPGLTGYAQVNGGYDLYPEEKIVYDLEYIKNRSFRMDFKCIMQTFPVFFKSKGAM